MKNNVKDIKMEKIKKEIKEIAKQKLNTTADIRVELVTNMEYLPELAVTAMVYYTQNGKDYVYHFAHADDDVNYPYYSMSKTYDVAWARFMDNIKELDLYGYEYVPEWQKNMIAELESGFISDAQYWLDKYDTNNEYELDTENIKDMAKEWAVNSFDNFLIACENKGIDPNDVIFDYSFSSDITDDFKYRSKNLYILSNAVTDYAEIKDCGYVKKKKSA